MDGGERLDALFEAQGRNRWTMAASGAAERIDRLRRLKSALLGRAVELQAAVYKDFGKSADEAWMTEIFPVVEEINYTVKRLRRWMKPRSAPPVFFMPGARSRLVYEPKGRVLILAPWNYPVHLALAPLVSAIAAGNVAILKPSNKTPASSAFIASLVEGVFPPDEVAVVEGLGSVLGDALLALPFDHVFFTGSPSIGVKVGEAAAKVHAGLTLELGGKSPVVLLRGADVADAARKVMWGKGLNAGQTCLAPDYLLCPTELVDEFVREARLAVEAMYGRTEEARRSSPDLPRLVDRKACERLRGLCEETIAEGAQAAFGAIFDEAERYAAPTVLTGVSGDSAIMGEEIFGPILPVIAYGELGEAIEFVRARPKPLALYAFGRDRRAIGAVLSGTSSGTACVNDLIVQIENLALPFGGVGMSGTGSYHGFFGFKTFSHERNVMRQGFPNLLGAFYPPYGRRLQRALRGVIEALSRAG